MLMREAIINGELKPGQHLVEQVIAERFQVSRSPVREALAALQKLGLVEHVRHRGNFVSEMNVEQYQEIYRIRATLEGLVCSLAAPHTTEADVAELHALNREMREAMHDAEAFLAVNARFHRVIHRISRSPIAAQLIEELWDKCSVFRRAYLSTREAMLESIRDHEMITDALAARDAELAKVLGSRAVSKRWSGLSDKLGA